MSRFPELNFTFTRDMPDPQGAFIFKKNVYVNSNKSYRQILQNVAEEIGHYVTSFGNIYLQKNTLERKQELRAREYGYKMLISLDGLIDCYEHDITNPWEVADYFEVDEDYLWGVIETLKAKRGNRFDYNGYTFDLTNGLNICKLVH